MIIIHHNFDETKFKWLWAKYVRGGRIEKHCTASIPGLYSKKFSGTSNRDLLSQPTLCMDEVQEDMYEAIYYCGVLKKGYLQNDPLKNNYRHNVHFAVRPMEGAHDVWDFENWHVEIENGILERIPETYELHDKFFAEPYNSHFYTCRIFRWMVGHFYPELLHDVPRELAAKLNLPDSKIIELDLAIKNCIKQSKCVVDSFMNSDLNDRNGKHINVASKLGSSYVCFAKNESLSPIQSSQNVARQNLASYLVSYINLSVDTKEYEILGDKLCDFIQLGVEEALEMYFPYQDRKFYSDIF